MKISACTAETPDYLASLRRLLAGRWAVFAVLALFVMIGPGVLDVPVPQLPLLGILVIASLFNALAQWRAHVAHAASDCEFFVQLLFDIGTLSAVVFFSGGATNPLVSLLLPPVAIAALTLPVRFAVSVILVAIAAYSLLMLFYLPLPMPDAARATRLHLIGMWLIFAISAVMIGWIIVRMTGLIRERDAALAAAREQALRDQQVMAIGTLAAGAAHELGTPLGTMALLAGELARLPELSNPVREDIALLRQQIGVCKEIITGLSHRAGAGRLEAASQEAADRWLETLRQRWHASRPQAASWLRVASEEGAPPIVADPRLELAILNLLNNAANASTSPVEILLNWDETHLVIDIRDHGPGFPAKVLSLGGTSSFPAHELGSGIGLMLTRSAIEQLGGILTLRNPENGGAHARIELPRTKA